MLYAVTMFAINLLPTAIMLWLVNKETKTIGGPK